MNMSITINSVESSDKDGASVIFKMRDGKIKLNIGSDYYAELHLGFDCVDGNECLILTSDQVKSALSLPINAVLYSVMTLKFKVNKEQSSVDTSINAVFSRGSEFEYLSRLGVSMTCDYTYVPH